LEDIFTEGEIGGHCELDLNTLRENGEQKSPLQSWYAELGGYRSLEFRVDGRKNCDEIVTKPTIFIKLDAVVNLYHHFCDFFNLYASQHINGSFSDDIYIVIWDTTLSKELRDLFIETWSAFTRHPVKMLSHFEGKRVCFRDVVFSLLARMRRGLYYNTYLVPGCSGSGLMQAFTKHLIPRLGIRQEVSEPHRLRVTLLSRTTKQRRFVNEDQLVNAMKTVGYFDVRVVDYKYRDFPFLDQIKASHNSDIFMGIHGAGLTHMIFLPDWAGIFEMYNTEDPKCYHDLARLRGIEYITWEKGDKIWKEAEGYSPTSGKPSPKFTNYTLDVAEMMRLVTGLGDRVRQRKMDSLSHTLFTLNSD
jgi:protein O-GlcNAc transferase